MSASGGPSGPAAQPPRADDAAGRGATRYEGVSFTPDGTPVVEDCSFSLEPGEIVALIGPSGCGKSTLAELLAGYRRPSAGRVVVDGDAVTGPSADRLLLFQETALLPWLTTRDNVLFGPRARREDKAASRRRADELLGRMGLEDFADRYPGELSGGMQRRAELARALINDPAVLVLDEPFRGLDALTRELMQEFCASVLLEHRRTTLFITTDVDEAILLADRLVVLSRKPATVRDELVVDLPRPRDRALLLEADDAQAVKARALRLLQEEAAPLPTP